MRYVAPARDVIDPVVFTRAPLNAWSEFDDWMTGPHWPTLAQLNARWPSGVKERFVAQTRGLLEDGLHYEQRIARDGLIATREENWHDLFNAMIWLRYPQLKRALNRQQAADVARLGTRQRSRAQCAQTHFDEAGVVVMLRDPGLLKLWDAHDWHGLFWRYRGAWGDGSISVEVFGHALLEHALSPGTLLVGKAVVIDVRDGAHATDAITRCADAITAGHLLRDPQELRPLPLSGIPGWHADNESEVFHLTADCYRPLRPGRRYPAPLGLSLSATPGSR